MNKKLYATSVLLKETNTNLISVIGYRLAYSESDAKGLAYEKAKSDHPELHIMDISSCEIHYEHLKEAIREAVK